MTYYHKNLQIPRSGHKLESKKYFYLDDDKIKDIFFMAYNIEVLKYF